MAQKITIDVEVHAPIEKVWQMWNDPFHIVQWCSGSADWETPYAENDLKEGGKFKTTMRAKDGSEGFDFIGTYTRVVPQERIEYTIDDGRTVSVQFEDMGGETKITEIFEMENINSEELQRGGWQTILNNFKEHVEGN